MTVQQEYEPSAQRADARARRDERRRRRRTVGIAVAVLAAIVIGALAWVVVRGLMARDELLGALPIARSVQSTVAAGDSDVADELAELQRRSASARSLTGDPVWRAMEVLPWAGQNLQAFREAAEVIDDVAVDALPPLGDLAASITLSSLTPQDGAIALQPIIDAGPALSTAAEAMRLADERASAIETEGTLPQITGAVDELAALIDETAGIVSGLDTAAQLLPGMLGAEGERTYLMLFLNNAELRASSGIPGALSTLSATNGAIGIVEQSSASELGRFAPPPVLLTEEEAAIYPAATDDFMQNVTATPQFSRTAVMAQGMWAERTGESVDGVVGIDVGALALMLEATGPIALPGDIEITSDNAVDVLLSEVYARIPNPADQDLFFAAAAQQIFSAVTSGGVDPTRLLDALAQGVADNRISIWSADADEQSVLQGIGLTGELPQSTAGRAMWGVYLNDSTGAKMDYYLQNAISLGAAVCRQDERPTYQLTTRLESTAPADAATSLPAYVTGDGAFGVPAGTIRTNTFMYAPAGSVIYDVRVNGASTPFALSEHEGLPVAALTVDLQPNEYVSVTVLAVAAEGGPVRTGVEHTAMTNDVPIARDQPVDCADVAPPAG